MSDAPSDLAASEEANPEFFESVGHAVIAWSRLEALMGMGILRLYEIEARSGLVLTANIGFKGLGSILRIWADALEPATGDALRKLLNEIDRAYQNRNLLAHGVWTCTNNPDWVIRSYIRARNQKLSYAIEPYEISVIHDWTGSFVQLFRELDVFLDTNAPPLGYKP